MAFWIYNAFLVIGLALGWPFLLACLVFIPKMRAGFWEKCGFFNSRELAKMTSNKPVIILHAVSVGEFMAAKPLIQWLSTLDTHQLVLTQTTRTGHELATKTYPDLPALYFPFDFPWVIHAWLKRLSPKLILMMETEIWPNLALLHNPKTTALVMLNGRLSERSTQKYRWIRAFLKPVFYRYQGFWMQSERDAKHLLSLCAPADRVSVLGNLKTCAPVSVGVVSSRAESPLQQLLKNDWKEALVWVCASTHEDEEARFLKVFKTLKAQCEPLKWVLVPRHPERFDRVALLLEKSGLPFQRWTQLVSAVSSSTVSPDVVLVDVMGELQGLFPYATVVTMGGSFVPTGGHNMMEPLQAGAVVTTGPYMHNFTALTEATCEAGALIQVPNEEALAKRLGELLQSPVQRAAMREAGRAFLETQENVLNAYQKSISSLL